MQVSDEEIQKRIIARFVNEAIYCLQDGVIRNPVRRHSIDVPNHHAH
jgi:hypothetical protein